MGTVVNLATYRKAVDLPLAAATLTPHPADDLSFMRRLKPKGWGINYWVVDATGNYGTDCERGAELGAEYLSYIGEHPTYGNGTLLGCIVRSMMERTEVRERGRPTGIEIAFLAAVNRHAMSAAYVMRNPAAH